MLGGIGYNEGCNFLGEKMHIRAQQEGENKERYTKQAKREEIPQNKVHMWSATKTSIARAPLHEIQSTNTISLIHESIMEDISQQFVK